MAGGLLNLVSYGSQNVILNGNPSKTFFKCAYAKYTNFGMQKFRVDYDGQKTLRLSQDSKFTFKFPRYADLLMDTYLVVTLPTIWSPFYSPDDDSSTCFPYEFKWIDNLGTQMIKEITFSVSGHIIQKFSGQYLYNLVERDFSVKRGLYYKMTGNVDELNDPAAFNGGLYPNAVPTVESHGAEPSIRSRKLYIPINVWFTLMHKLAFPLVSVQYGELQMEITLRPIEDLFVVRDVTGDDPTKYVKANQNISEYGFYRFLHQPPIDGEYTDKRTDWMADIHLLSTYCFLSEEEVRVFAAQPQNYLIKQVYEYTIENSTGNGRATIDSLGMVSNWMWYFQRSDVNLRNEWSNYSNWPYKGVKPYPVMEDDTCESPNAGVFQIENQEEILLGWGILLNGEYRENYMDSGVYKYVEQYTRTSGYTNDGLYCYNFCLNTDPLTCQPSGGLNVSNFKTVEFEYATHQPPLDPDAQTLTICDPDSTDGLPIGINKPVWRLYDYNYNLHIFEERYNVLKIQSGNAGLMYAR